MSKFTCAQIPIDYRPVWYTQTGLIETLESVLIPPDDFEHLNKELQNWALQYTIANELKLPPARSSLSWCPFWGRISTGAVLHRGLGT